MTWCLKYLSQDPNMQSTLRKEIVSALTTSTPSVETIKESKIPYLDAFIEELLRLCQPAPFVSRGALIDTEILGYKIPKDTEVFFATNSASILQPAYSIEEKLRSTTCRTAVYRTGAWNPADIGAFKPERWLKTDEKGEVYFDAKAGPILAFGLGTRGCFGKRFAYQQLRLLIVLLVMTFELLEVPEELGSMKAVQKLVRGPEQCYVKLRAL